MIPVDRLLYKIDLKLNKVSSQQNQFIADEDKLIALNEAQIRLIKSKVDTKRELGFDSFRSRYEELQNLVVPYEEVSPTKTQEVLSSYQINLNSLKKKYYLPVDIIAIANRGKCTNREIFVNRIVKHSDLTLLLRNSHYKPDFLWQESLATISNNNLVIYSDDFEINKVLFSYLRFPQEIDIEGYIHLDGTPSITKDCELGDELEDELLEMTLLELGFDITDQNAVTAAQQKLNT